MDKLKIAVFTDTYFPGTGGTENALANLLRALKKSSNEIIIFAPNYHKEQKDSEFEVFRVKSLKLDKNNMLALPLLDHAKIMKKIQSFAPDIIYFCTASGMAKEAIKIGKKIGKPVVATIHTKFHLAFKDGIKSSLVTKILINKLKKRLNAADLITTVSNDMAGVLKTYGVKKEIHVVRNGTDMLSFENFEATKSSSPHNFVYCGSLLKIKNIHFSLLCLKNLKENYHIKDFTFTIIGAGNYRKKLEKLVEKYNLKQNIRFTGLIKDRDVLAEEYCKADLMLFPSTFDTDGLVILEAAQAGTPTLALKGYGCGERIVDGETGFLSEYDSKKYTKKLYDIISSPQLYSHVQKNVRNLKGSSWSDISKEYIRLFEKAISEKSAIKGTNVK